MWHLVSGKQLARRVCVLFRGLHGCLCQLQFVQLHAQQLAVLLSDVRCSQGEYRKGQLLAEG